MSAPSVAVTVEALLDAAVTAVPGGIRRPGQLAMAEAIAAAVDQQEHLLVQAGTGTGKSLGYLVPALLSGRRVVVATATLALQAQLLNTDLPQLADVAEQVLGRRPRFAVLKGRQHYACHAKLDASSADSLFDDGPTWVGEVTRLGKQVATVRSWAEMSTTGDRAELKPDVSDDVWRQVSMAARECIGATKCPFGEECFAETARDQARQADIVVANHTLLAIDLSRGGGILPPHSLLIVDEAHELSTQVTSAARAELAAETLTRITRRAGRNLPPAERDRLADAASALDDAVAAAPLTQLRPLPAELAAAATSVQAAARAASTAMGPIADDDGDVVARNQVKNSLSEVVETAGRILADADHDVVWVAADERGRRTVSVAPLSVAGLLRAGLFAEERTVVLTSATLAYGGGFTGLARSLGLPDPADPPSAGDPAATDAQSTNDSSGEANAASSDESAPPRWRSLDVGSPFDYPRQGILYVAARLPRPTTSGLSEPAAAELVRLVTAAGGRTLGLFSSRKAADAAAAALRAETELPILLQGEGALPTLVQKFRDDPRSCLLGVMSLWQGVDVPGPACQLVVVDRLPFPRPDEPLSAARARVVDEAGGSGFMAVSVPHAAVRLAQGAGRLIRRAADRGVVAVLDSRLHSARYGMFVRRTLPPFWYTTDGSLVCAALERLDKSDT